MNTYKFCVELCGGSCEGHLVIEGDDAEDAYNKAMSYVGEQLSKSFPELIIDYYIDFAEEDNIELCACCGKQVDVTCDDYEKISGDIVCDKCVNENYGKCEWCNEYVDRGELAWYGNILCCDDCATNYWEEMEEAHNWR